jgi:hypothetical protein
MDNDNPNVFDELPDGEGRLFDESRERLIDGWPESMLCPCGNIADGRLRERCLDCETDEINAVMAEMGDIPPDAPEDWLDAD